MGLRIKKTFAISLVAFFVLSLTAAAVSANSNGNWIDGFYNGDGNWNDGLYNWNDCFYNGDGNWNDGLYNWNDCFDNRNGNWNDGLYNWNSGVYKEALKLEFWLRIPFLFSILDSVPKSSDEHKIKNH